MEWNNTTSPIFLSMAELKKMLNKNNMLLICTERWANDTLLHKYLNVKMSEFENVLILPSGEPESVILDEKIKFLNLNSIDYYVALGGGSTIDSAKMIAILHAGGGTCIDYETGRLQVPTTLPSIIAIPTTAGSGSEASLYTVINDSITERKFTLSNTALIPKGIVFQPKLCFELSDRVIIASGMDALIQAFEAFFSLRPHPIASNLAIIVMHTILTVLPKVIKNPRDHEAWKMMQNASFLSGVCINYTRTGLIHTTSVAMAKYYSLLHGELNTVILPHVIKFNKYNYNPAEYSLTILLKLLNLDSFDSFLDHIISFSNQWKLKLIKKTEPDLRNILNRIKQDKGLPLVNPSKLEEKKLISFINEVIIS